MPGVPGRVAIVKDRSLWIALAALAAFGGSLASGFHFDDFGMLQDRAVVSPDGWLSCFSWLQTRPLTWLSFWLNFQLSGRDPLLWHALNIAIHIACAVLLYRLLRRIMPEAALLAALLFAAHPVMSEAVDYIYARAILLATLFSLLALLYWIRGRVWISVLWFAAAVFAKEECVTVPLVLALIAWRGRVAPLSAMLAISAAAGMRVLAAIQATGMVNIGLNAGVSPFAYLVAQGFSLCRSFGLLVVPWAFSVDPQIPGGGWLGWLAIVALIVVCVVRYRSVRAA
jgi:hypothetical protein